MGGGGRTLFEAFGLAPAASSTDTPSSHPSNAALCSAVLPAWRWGAGKGAGAAGGESEVSARRPRAVEVGKARGHTPLAPPPPEATARPHPPTHGGRPEAAGRAADTRARPRRPRPRRAARSRPAFVGCVARAARGVRAAACAHPPPPPRPRGAPLPPRPRRRPRPAPCAGRGRHAGWRRGAGASAPPGRGQPSSRRRRPSPPRSRTTRAAQHPREGSSTTGWPPWRRKAGERKTMGIEVE